MKLLRFLFVAPLLLSCADDDGDDIGVDSHAVCDCPELTATDIAYDNAGSGLADDDLQGAVDELASRPEGLVDGYDRVAVIELVETSSATGTDFGLTVACPASPPDSPKALGGSCRGGSAGVSLQSSWLQSTGFSCYWNKPEGEAIEFTATVTCLSKAGAE